VRVSLIWGAPQAILPLEVDGIKKTEGIATLALRPVKRAERGAVNLVILPPKRPQN